MIKEEIQSAMLRVYCEAGDAAGQRLLHDAIVEAAREAGLAGATAMTGKMGLTRSGNIYSDVLSEVEMERQPVVVEIMDLPERIEAFLPSLHGLVRGRRLITVERARVVHYHPGT